MQFDNYEKMLERARVQIPEDIAEEEQFKPPEVKIRGGSGQTVILNWNELVRAANDQEKILLRFLSHQLATHGRVTQGKVEFKGNLSTRKINNLMEEFIEKYVICSECGRPDTKLKKEKKHLLKKCQACGAWEFVEPP